MKGVWGRAVYAFCLSALPACSSVVLFSRSRYGCWLSSHCFYILKKEAGVQGTKRVVLPAEAGLFKEFSLQS